MYLCNTKNESKSAFLHSAPLKASTKNVGLQSTILILISISSFNLCPQLTSDNFPSSFSEKQSTVHKFKLNATKSSQLPVEDYYICQLPYSTRSIKSIFILFGRLHSVPLFDFGSSAAHDLCPTITTCEKYPAICRLREWICRVAACKRRSPHLIRLFSHSDDVQGATIPGKLCREESITM